eukprot:5226287-Pleurochrysis_carterae.AAC.2
MAALVAAYREPSCVPGAERPSHPAHVFKLLRAICFATTEIIACVNDTKLLQSQRSASTNCAAECLQIEGRRIRQLQNVAVLHYRQYLADGKASCPPLIRSLVQPTFSFLSPPPTSLTRLQSTLLNMEYASRCVQLILRSPFCDVHAWVGEGGVSS